MYTLIEFMLFFSIIIRLLGVYKKPKNILACGLFGACGLNIDYSKIITLGTANDSRGGDGNGYFNGKNLVKGIDNLKRFENHVKEDPLIKNRDGLVFIGHTRKATHGEHTSENTHPFLVGEVGKQIILAHNGQIFNTKEMCEKYDVDATGIKVDSKILAILIQKVGFKTILEEYKGYAALIWTDLNEPDSLYMYHGASKEYDYVHSKVDEERPLFYIQLRNTIYFSSMIEPLKLIRETKKQKPYAVPVNKVFKIKRGVMSGKVEKIDRERTNVGLSSFRYPASTPSYAHTNPTPSRVGNHFRTPPTNSGYTGYTNNYPSKIQDVTPMAIDIHSGFCQLNSWCMPKKDIFWWGGRYYYRLPNSPDKAELCEGALYIDKHSYSFERCILKVKGMKFQEDYDEIPEEKPIFNGVTNVTGTLMFFHKGIMMKNKHGYKNLLTRYNNVNDVLSSQMTNPTFNICSVLSLYAKHPIVLLPTESVSITNNNETRRIWYLDGKPANCTDLSPQMSDTEFSIKDGKLNKCTKITELSKTLPKLLPQPIINELPFDNDDKKEVDAAKAKMDATKDTELYKTYMVTINEVPISEHHANRLVDDILEEAIYDLLKEYHSSKTADFRTFADDEKEIFLNERYNELVLEDCISRSLSLKEGCADLERCSFYSLEECIAMAMKRALDTEMAGAIEETTVNENDDEDADVISTDEFTEEFTEEEIEDVISSEYLFKQAEGFQTIDNDFAQAIAMVLFKNDERLKEDLKTVCEKHGKTSLIEIIVETQKNIK